MRLLIRTDAAQHIGSGHVMRCLTLARAARAAGHQVWFACRLHQGHLATLLQQEQFPLLALPLQCDSVATGSWLGCTETEDAAALITACQPGQNTPALPSFDWLVIDHYGLGAMFAKQCRTLCRFILQIDDLANRPYDCDLLLDQNLLAGYQHRYQQWVPAGCRLLLGPAYALLRPEFAVSPARDSYPHSSQSSRLLVFFSGNDPENYTQIAIVALQSLQDFDWQADIVVGQANPHLLLLQQLCAKDRRLTLHIQTPGMAGLMATADLMIGAGGATYWERLSMRLPSLVVVLADNQQATTDYLAQAGACVNLGPAAQLTADKLSSEIRRLLSNRDLLQQMAQAAAELMVSAANTSGTATVLTTMEQIAQQV